MTETSKYDEIEEENECNNDESHYLEKVAHRAENQRVCSESDDDGPYYGKRKTKQLYSEIWTKFTIISRKHYIASCNVCGARLSFKTTISNLKKHVERKHNYDIRKSSILPYQPKRKSTLTGRPKLTELGGLDGLILNVVADEGEDPVEIVGQEVEQSEIQDKVHDYCIIDGENQREHPTKSTSRDPKTNDRNEKMKRNRIIDLQLECLELKKYSMQMETLLLERQLNLPRSIYTENLRGGDIVTRGTQTDVGGGNTKVFYVTDKQASGNMSQHLFTFQAKLQE